MKLINGRQIAADEIAKLKLLMDAADSVPCLAVVVVGERPDSATYVRMKRNAAAKIGIEFREIHLDESVDQSIVEQCVRALVNDVNVDGVIIQLPLPARMDASTITQLVSPEKDVDGFHPINAGGAILDARPLFTGCTARGVMELLAHVGVELRGACVVLVGTGMVGKPLSALLMQAEATVICCNKYTQQIAKLCRLGDVVIAAAGCPNLVKRDWVRPGAVVIDVGINSVVDATSGKRKLTGDVDFQNVLEVVSRITPVPGGVGPMTVAMLMKAVVESWQRKIKMLK